MRSIVTSAIAILIWTVIQAQGARAADLFPSNGDSNVCPDIPLRITFNSAPTLGAGGKIQIYSAKDDSTIETIDIEYPTKRQTIGGMPNYRYYPITISGNTVTIHPRNHALNYNGSYYVTVDAGVFKDGGSDFAGISDKSAWKFTTKAAPPPAGATELIIAADGSGDFCTLQGALDFVPDANTTPTTLFLRKGIYTELVYVANKHALKILGEDRKQSVLEYANNARFNSVNERHSYHRGVFLAARCDDLTLQNLTIRNTTPHGGSQAEAIILNGTPAARAIVYDVDLYSFQDTMQINGQAYIRDSYIEGDVDFLWGSGPCYFENCHCYGTRSKAYYTQIRNTAANHGYVFHHCTFDGPDGVKDMFLSRIDPKVYPYSEVVLVDCVLGKSVGSVAWLLNGRKGQPPGPSNNIHFWECYSRGPDGSPVEVSGRLATSRQLKQPDDAQTIADYSNASFVLGNDWTPQVPQDPPKKPPGR